MPSNYFYSLDQIDYGVLKEEMERAIQACISDINKDSDLTKARQVSVTIKMTPGEDGNIEIAYDVTPKLAKREGKQDAYVGRDGKLYLGEQSAQIGLPLEEAE